MQYQRHNECPKKGKKFHNPHVNRIYRGLWDIFLWKIGYYRDPKPPEIPKGFTYPQRQKTFDPSLSFVSWVNHATCLVNFLNQVFLTDPIWSDYCSPITLPNFKRKHPPGIELRDLPRIDYVLISHNHYDHLDKQTVLNLQRIYPTMTWIVPTGLKKWFHYLNIDNTVELKWWESYHTKHKAGSIKITAVPTQHFSGRFPFGTNQSLWSGYVCEQETKRFYFVGDTGYNPYHFKEIHQEFGPMDLSLIPIGTYSPKKFMQAVHISPEEAVTIHRETESKFSLAIHWKTFQLSNESMDAPPYELYESMKKANLDPTTFIATNPGEYFNW